MARPLHSNRQTHRGIFEIITVFKFRLVENKHEKEVFSQSFVTRTFLFYYPESDTASPKSGSETRLIKKKISSGHIIGEKVFALSSGKGKSPFFHIIFIAFARLSQFELDPLIPLSTFESNFFFIMICFKWEFYVSDLWNCIYSMNKIHANSSNFVKCLNEFKEANCLCDIGQFGHFPVQSDLYSYTHIIIVMHIIEYISNKISLIIEILHYLWEKEIYA